MNPTLIESLTLPGQAAEERGCSLQVESQQQLAGRGKERGWVITWLRRCSWHWGGWKSAEHQAGMSGACLTRDRIGATCVIPCQVSGGGYGGQGWAEEMQLGSVQSCASAKASTGCQQGARCVKAEKARLCACRCYTHIHEGCVR